MLAYLIIAIELVILYTVFWYVFLREPRPYKIKGNPWGGYTRTGYSEDAYTRGGYPSSETTESNSPAGHYPSSKCEAASSGSPAYMDAKSRQAAIYEEWNVAEPRVPHTVGELIRSQTGGVERLATGSEDGACQATIPIENIFPAGTKFLQELGERLNRINIKLP